LVGEGSEGRGCGCQRESRELRNRESEKELCHRAPITLRADIKLARSTRATTTRCKIKKKTNLIFGSPVQSGTGLKTKNHKKRGPRTGPKETSPVPDRELHSPNRDNNCVVSNYFQSHAVSNSCHLVYDHHES